MDNFSKLMADLLAEGKSLEEAVRAIAAKAAKDAIESFARSELSAHLGYEKGGRRASGASDARNGSYERTVQTSFGPITVSVPRDRDGDFRTAALPRYKRKTEVISSAILKLYSSGMTDEEMRVVIESLYDADVSKSYVSSVTDAVLADVEEFKKRPLPPRFFCLYLDSTYLPLRRDSVQREAVNIAMGIDAEGSSMVVGYSITPEESAEAYRELLANFKSRGLAEVAAAVSDGLAGIDGAVDASFPKAKRQRCFLHLMRNLCSKVRPSDRKEAASDFMSLSKKASKEEAEGAFAEFKGKWGPNANPSPNGPIPCATSSPSTNSRRRLGGRSTPTTRSRGSTSRSRGCARSRSNSSPRTPWRRNSSRCSFTSTTGWAEGK